MAMLLYIKVDLGTVYNSFCEATVCKELVFGHYIFGFDNSICFLFGLGHWLHLFPMVFVHIFGELHGKTPGEKTPVFNHRWQVLWMKRR